MIYICNLLDNVFFRYSIIQFMIACLYVQIEEFTILFVPFSNLILMYIYFHLVPKFYY